MLNKESKTSKKLAWQEHNHHNATKWNKNHVWIPSFRELPEITKYFHYHKSSRNVSISSAHSTSEGTVKEVTNLIPEETGNITLPYSVGGELSFERLPNADVQDYRGLNLIFKALARK